MKNMQMQVKVMDKIEDLVRTTNDELTLITTGGFPFVFDEVKMSAEEDSAGIYVHSGDTPVCAIPRTGNSDTAFDMLSDSIREMVELTREAVMQRGTLEEDAKALSNAESTHAKAVEALQSAGIDTKILRDSDCDREAATQIVNAAKEAVEDANKMCLPCLIPLTGFRRSEWKMTVRGYNNGFVLMGGRKPILVTRFPRVNNPVAIEKMINFLGKTIHAIGCQRKDYLEKVRFAFDREEELRATAQQIDAANQRLTAIAM